MTAEERAIKREKRREVFADYFETINNPKAYFTPKSVIGRDGKRYYNILVYKSELKNPDGIYFELTDVNLEPISSKILYHLEYDPYWADLYKQDPNNSDLYRIPIEQAEIVYKEGKIEQLELFEFDPPVVDRQKAKLETMLKEIRDSIDKYLNN